MVLQENFHDYLQYKIGVPTMSESQPHIDIPSHEQTMNKMVYGCSKSNENLSESNLASEFSLNTNVLPTLGLIPLLPRLLPSDPKKGK